MIRNNSHRETVITMKNLAVGYGLKKVLCGVTADIHKGSFVSLLGPNGAGKTTLLRTLSRHLSKIGGTLTLGDRPIEKYRQKELAATLAVVFTSRLDTELFTGFEFAAMGRHPHTGMMGTLTGQDREKVWESLGLVSALDLAHRQMNELSDGEKQKLYIARAICQEPKIIILDEPTAHLDLTHQMEIMTIPRNSCREKGITIIASIHDLAIAARISDLVALVKDGTVIAWGSPEEVLNQKSVSALYDIHGAFYDRTTGTLEMKPTPGTHKVFCVSGSGTGAVLFRTLIRNGISVTTGVLHESDVDCYVARAMGIEAISAPPFGRIEEALVAGCAGPLTDADCVIDTGFPLGEMNRKNLDLLGYALKKGKPVISLRKREEYDLLGLSESTSIIVVEGEQAVLDSVIASTSR
jgi:iron complex transport system ATP-binding protein